MLDLVVTRGPLDLIDINRFARPEGLNGREVSAAVKELARCNAIRKQGIEWHATSHGRQLADDKHEVHR